MWPRSPGQHKRTFSSFLLLEIWVCEFATAILHVFIRESVADTLGLANWKDEEEPGPWWHCWVPCWGCDLSQQPCLTLSICLGRGGQKEGCKMINSPSYTNVFGWSMERVLERIKAGSEGSWEVCCKRPVRRGADLARQEARQWNLVA